MARQRGTTWQADIILRSGKRLRPGGFQSEADATLWEAQARVADERGLEPPPVHGRSTAVTGSSMSLGDLRKRVMATAAPDGWKGTKAIDTADENSAMVVKFFGADMGVASIDVNEVDRYVAALGDAGNSGGTINRKLAALSKMLKFAKHRGLIAAMPHIARQQEAEGRLRYLTWEEEARALAVLELMGEHDVRQLVIFLLDTGCRVGEALALTQADAEGTTVTFWVTKGGKPRTVPLTPRAKAAVACFETLEGGPFSWCPYWRVRSIWEKACAKLGVSFGDVVLHTLRHTCCSRLVQAGWDLARVMKWMGHKNIQTTLRYAHLAPDDLKDMTGALARPAPEVT
jgi:integrase